MSHAFSSVCFQGSVKLLGVWCFRRGDTWLRLCYYCAEETQGDSCRRPFFFFLSFFSSCFWFPRLGLDRSILSAVTAVREKKKKKGPQGKEDGN